MSVTITGNKKGNICRKSIFLLFGMCLVFFMQAFNGYKITLNSNLKNHKVYIWYIYGNNRYPVDTSMTNEAGTAVFTRHYEMIGGVFVMYLTPRKALEFLLTDENSFTINIDTADISGKTTFTGSRENALYYDFLRKINLNEFYLEDVKKKLARPERYKSDSLTLLKAMGEMYKKQDLLIKKQFIEKNNGTFVAHLVAAHMRPEVDRNQKVWLWQKEMKKRFFENVDFTDNRLSCSPALFNLYTDYIQDFTYKNGDSLIAACDTILKKASVGKENFKWSLYFLSSSFETSSVTGQDRVFVHLVEEYYKKGRCWWLTPDQIDNMARRAEVLKHLYVGTECPDFTAQDSSGKEITLYSKVNKLTVLYFWSYDCKHCLEETPKLAAWAKKHPGINLVTACATPEEDRWKEKLKEFRLPGTHLIDPELKANYTYLYSITSTPQYFVIDKNKKIVAKYLDDTKALDDFLKSYKTKS